MYFREEKIGGPMARHEIYICGLTPQTLPPLRVRQSLFLSPCRELPRAREACRRAATRGLRPHKLTLVFGFYLERK